MRPMAYFRRYYPLSSMTVERFADIVDEIVHTFPEWQLHRFQAKFAHKFRLLPWWIGNPFWFESKDPSRVIGYLRRRNRRIRKLEADVGRRDERRAFRDAVRVHLEYCFSPAEDFDNDRVGLYIAGSQIANVEFFRLESRLAALEYMPPPERESKVHRGLGRPCELLALVVDLRGFTNFCERPEIESPYVTKLGALLYDFVDERMSRIRPDLLKFLGDGLLACWELEGDTRQLVVEEALNGIKRVVLDYSSFLADPSLIYGAPQAVSGGVACGLAAALGERGDYFGRPINLASRLCAESPGGMILLDAGVPCLPTDHLYHRDTVELKSFGKVNVLRWVGQQGDQAQE